MAHPPSASVETTSGYAAATGRPPAETILRGRVLVRGAVAVALLLAAAHFVAVTLVHGLGEPGRAVPESVVLNAEGTVATWFSAALHLVNAALLALLAAAAGPRERRRWVLLAVMVLAVSVDEVSAFHEDVNWVLREHLDTSGVLTYVWVVPAVVVVAVVAATCARLVLARPGGVRVVLGTAVFLGGAVVVEVLQGWWIGTDGRTSDLEFLLLGGIEETMEMLGTVLAMSGLLKAVAGHGVRFPG
ncbi:MAG TPA: hypothetical protein VD813_09775 [Pseudonocardia sp.]|nr:hypothetical protein [Pseudonocardia sp.]